MSTLRIKVLINCAFSENKENFRNVYLLLLSLVLKIGGSFSIYFYLWVKLQEASSQGLGLSSAPAWTVPRGFFVHTLLWLQFCDDVQSADSFGFMCEIMHVGWLKNNEL